MKSTGIQIKQPLTRLGKKGKKMLETFVKERGIYYLIAGLCVIGAIGKLYESFVYRRLLKAAENPERTDHSFLKLLKLKYKSYHRLNRSINNINAFIETNMFRYKHHFMGLESVRTINARLMLLCIMASCAGVAASMYYDLGNWEMIYYILVGTLATAVLELVDLQCGNDSKRRFLMAALKDYLENVLANQVGGAEKEVPEIEFMGTQAQELGERAKNASQQVAASKDMDKKRKSKTEDLEYEISEKAAERIAQEKVIAEVIKEFFP
ncbi:MAG: hypothetical protein HFI75_08395 [Lachnospiraceae bacterium]|nr:hypothetical protein [Lachnospiraceae bacterium]